ncbi:MAG: Wzz/FepE/Etk N-terminal domain-containing protein, partial [Gaiellaceae bacterium]
MRRRTRALPWLVVIALTAAGAGGGFAYATLGPKTYTATAQIVVSPVPEGDTTFTGIDVLRDQGGKRTAAQTAAALVSSPQIADTVRQQLGGTRSRESYLGAVAAREIGGSDVVAIVAHDSSPAVAAQIANAFADSLVSQRTATFQSELATAVAHDTQTLGSLRGAGRASLARRIALLQTYVGQPDPTIRHTAQAEPASAGAGRHARHWALLGAAAGFVAGVLLALL